MTAPTVLLDWEGLKARGIMLSRTRIYVNMGKGLFPKPIRVSANRIAWLSDEIDRWIEARRAARDEAA